MAELLILGNGFDLSCGLTSSYKDYMEYAFNEEAKQALDKCYEQLSYHNYNRSGEYSRHIFIESYGRNDHHFDYFNLDVTIDDLNTFSFWEILFYLKKKDSSMDWCDVEANIASFVNSNPRNSTNNFYYSYLLEKNLVSNDYNYLKSNEHSKYIINLAHIICSSLSSKLDKEVSVFEYLADELKKFEVRFSEYLEEQTLDNYNYLNKAEEKFSKMISTERVFSILNFNYTFPVSDNLIKNSTFKVANNLHGTLKNQDVIFGIDSKGILPSSNLYRFTKTYRQFFGTFIDSRSKALPEKDGLKAIKIYGHSLSEADYSYFESLFDYYDIYSSDISFVFYYSPYDRSKPKHFFIENQVKAITKLFETYSNKINNENLLHKLLLEQRIKLECI